MARADMPDYYAILGVDKAATDADVKKAYRQLVRTAHPDVGGNPALFQMITLAYDTLKDPTSRKDYDKALSGPAGGPSTSEPAGYAEEDLLVALAEQERILRAQWEAEARRHAAQPAAVPAQGRPSPAQGPAHPVDQDMVELDRAQMRLFRQIRALGYLLTGSLFGLAYLLRSLGAFDPLVPESGPLHTVARVLAGFDAPLLAVAIGLGVALEHFLAPSFRVIDTVNPWARRFAGASFFWLVLVGEYLSTSGGQLVAGVGVAVCMTTLLLPRSVRVRIDSLQGAARTRITAPFRRRR